MRRVTTEQGTVAEKPWGRGRVSTLFLILVELEKMAEISRVLQRMNSQTTSQKHRKSRTPV